MVLKDLRVEIAAGGQGLLPVDGVSFEVAPRECVALLGESGCGKSLTALALMRLLPEGLAITGGEARLDDTDLFALPERAMQGVRGGRLAMVFQEPMLSLNPVMTIGQQITEALAVHRRLQGSAAEAGIGQLLDAVGLAPELAASYPFQLSGGQKQRALIATMLAGEPKVLIADEPTTALDVTVQAQILRLLKRLQAERGMGLLLITHDLDVARDMADRVVIMYAGQIVEWAPRGALYERPFHPYTQKLFSVLPSASRRGERLDHIPGTVPPLGTRFAGCRFADRCAQVWARCRQEVPGLHEVAEGHFARCHLAVEPRPVAVAAVPAPVVQPVVPITAPLLAVRDLAVHFPIRKGLLRRVLGTVKAVDGVSLQIAAGETLALVGESGCGKTTLARAILRLIEPTAGSVRLGDEEIGELRGEALRQKRAEMQIVFQDPFSSLNPRMRVGEILEEGMQALRPELAKAERKALVAELLQSVGLEPGAALRYPHAFSGGQRQRIAIARALAVGPKLLICDEPTSALDVSVQAQILNLLQGLQRERGLAYLFISHNLAVVGYLAHRVAVMYRGRIVETGPAADLMAEPLHPYTRLLLDSAPGRGLAQVEAREGGLSNAGCAFAARCPRVEPACRQSVPELRALDDRQVACHLVK
ncbi:ABC transporter ATP-binding protein [Sulfuritortus calidifontis]|uniref:ABC transporter ATP-binding protein n=1 Tax=Sulfuritortus calidifontis TaxID=1914471 RepID=UPI001E3B8BE7|nr:ABC transporter ATP-binding protein [Sulfuritortus calidifontis]